MQEASIRKLYSYPLYALIIISVTVAAAFVTFKVLSRGITVTVPDITDMGRDEAEMALRSVGLTLVVEDERFDTAVADGHVLEQNVEPGTRVRGSVEVGVILSMGPVVRLIPSVVGLELDEAKQRLLEAGDTEQKGLNISKIVKVHSERQPEGVVIAQTPAPGKRTGQSVTLVVSSGPYDVIYYCPSFIGMTRGEAILLASELGLKAEVTRAGWGNMGSLAVKEQRPAPGSELKPGDQVYLTIGGSNG